MNYFKTGIVGVFAVLALCANVRAEERQVDGRDSHGNRCSTHARIDKWADYAAVKPGLSVNYHIAVHNLGSCDLADLNVVDRLPHDFKYTGVISPTPTPDHIPFTGQYGGTVSWDNFALNAGGTMVFSFTGTVNPSVNLSRDDFMLNTACMDPPAAQAERWTICNDFGIRLSSTPSSPPTDY